MNFQIFYFELAFCYYMIACMRDLCFFLLLLSITDEHLYPPQILTLQKFVTNKFSRDSVVLRENEVKVILETQVLVEQPKNAYT